MSAASPDREAHRAWLASLTTVGNGGIIVDLGCGRGDDLRLLTAHHGGERVRLVGVDASGQGPSGVQ